MDIYTFPSFHPSFSSLFSSCSLSVFCLPAPLNHHKSCHWLTSSLSLSVCLYSLFVAEQQSILFKETPEKWDTCLSMHTHRHTLTHEERHHNHGRSRTHKREGERERDGCLLSSGLPPLWLDRWMTSLCVCFLLSFSVFRFRHGEKRARGRGGKKRERKTGREWDRESTRVR